MTNQYFSACNWEPNKHELNSGFAKVISESDLLSEETELSIKKKKK